MTEKTKAIIGLLISVVYLFVSLFTNLGNYVVGVWLFGSIGGQAMSRLFKK